MSTKPTNLAPKQKEFLEKNFVKVIKIFQNLLVATNNEEMRVNVFLSKLSQELGVVDNVFYAPIYHYLYDKVKDKTKKIQRDEKRAFDRQVKLLDEVRVLAKEQNNLRVCLESIKEQNKLVGLYNFNFFGTSTGSKNLDNIQNKIYKELELELLDEDLDED